LHHTFTHHLGFSNQIPRFSLDGKFLGKFGSAGSGDGELWGICLDGEDHVFVADWLNNRVQVLTPEGRFITQFTGDGGLSKMGVAKLRSNPEMIRQRNDIRNFTPERVLWAPCAVKIGQNNRVIIADIISQTSISQETSASRNRDSAIRPRSPVTLVAFVTAK
jgi:hypothetical protein